MERCSHGGKDQELKKRCCGLHEGETFVSSVLEAGLPCERLCFQRGSDGGRV